MGGYRDNSEIDPVSGRGIPGTGEVWDKKWTIPKARIFIISPLNITALMPYSNNTYHIANPENLVLPVSSFQRPLVFLVRLGGAEKVKESPGSSVLVRDKQG